VFGEQVRCLKAITCLGVENRAEGVMPITASTRAAPHSSGWICAGPDRSLTWDGAASGYPDIPPTTVAIALRKVDFGAGSRGNPKIPTAITTKRMNGMFYSVGLIVVTIIVVYALGCW
jgi:hypothetical protein